MSHLVCRHNPAAAIVTLLALFISLASCTKRPAAERSTSERPAREGSMAQPPAAQSAAQKTFASPADAGAALLEAAKAGDQTALLAIFGSDGKDIVFSGDPVRDQRNLQEFVAAYNQMNRWGKLKAGGQVLYVGADNYPFPIPLDQNAKGQWYFDTAAGKDEILARRVGKDELTAIAASRAAAEAEREYFKKTHDGDIVRQYATKFVSDPGKHDGLYWPVAEGQEPSPLGRYGDFAKALQSGNSQPRSFNGYYFVILTKQGDQAPGGARSYVVNGKLTRGFAVLAFPAEYRNSGIMTFLVGEDGKVYQKDLGEKTAGAASTITAYNPADGWSPATRETGSAARAVE